MTPNWESSIIQLSANATIIVDQLGSAIVPVANGAVDIVLMEGSLAAAAEKQTKLWIRLYPQSIAVGDQLGPPESDNNEFVGQVGLEKSIELVDHSPLFCSLTTNFFIHHISFIDHYFVHWMTAF